MDELLNALSLEYTSWKQDGLTLGRAVLYSNGNEAISLRIRDSADGTYALNISLVGKNTLVCRKDQLDDVIMALVQWLADLGALKGESLEKIRGSALRLGDMLESIVLSDYMWEVPGYMFRECCESLTSIHLPESCRSIGDLAFYYCAVLSEITWPSELRRIEESAFESCHSLERIELPDQLEYIGENAFCDCRFLSYCRIPETVRFIADNAFDGCDSLVLAVTAGSYAEEYALRLSIRYVISE